MKNKKLAISYIIISFIFIFGVLLTFYNYSYSGYLTDKIIAWCWLIFTVMIIVFFWKKKSIKIYFFSLVTFLFLSILPMGVPFFGIVYYFSTIDDYQQIVLNDTYRIEITQQLVLSSPRIYIYKRVGLLEKNICRPLYREVKEIVSTIQNDANIKDENISIEDAQLITTHKDSLGIRYKISGKQKIVYHKLKNENEY